MTIRAQHTLVLSKDKKNVRESQTDKEIEL